MRPNAGFRGVAPILLVGFVLLGVGGYLYATNESAPRADTDLARSPEMQPDTTAASVSEDTSYREPIPKTAEAGVTAPMPASNYSAPSNYNYPSPVAQKTTCPDPFIFDLPIDITKATSILYPGQVRSGEFKAHGGFRFETSRPEEITVLAPVDAPVVSGARYPVNGEIQYTFEFEDPCGIRYRLGHLLTLTPKFQAIAEKFPLPTTLDSRTTQVYPPIAVKKGEVVATAVGLTGSGTGGTGQVNTFLDWGVYDYRQKNEASKDPAWAASHTSDTYQYAVCWFDWISPENLAKVLALPSSDEVSGTRSDYCK